MAGISKLDRSAHQLLCRAKHFVPDSSPCASSPCAESATTGTHLACSWTPAMYVPTLRCRVLCYARVRILNSAFIPRNLSSINALDWHETCMQLWLCTILHTAIYMPIQLVDSRGFTDWHATCMQFLWHRTCMHQATAISVPV